MARPERIAEGVYRVDALPIPNAINVLLLAGDDGWTLVDTGLGLSAGRIQAAMRSLGTGPDDLRRIVLTHHHPDHIGGLPAMLAWAPAAQVWASEGEADIIAGTRAADPIRNLILRRAMAVRRWPTAPVTRMLVEGDDVAGFRVIATPGHTRGHISLLRGDDLLFTADAFGNLLLSVRVGVLKLLCDDPEQARTSAAKLAGMPFSTVAFSHGATLRPCEPAPRPRCARPSSGSGSDRNGQRTG